MDRDLGSLDGIDRYVRAEIAGALEHALGVHGRLAPLGVVIAMRSAAGAVLANPEPAIFGGQHDSSDVVGHVRSLLRRHALRLAAIGVLWVDGEGSRGRVILEHSRFGDQEWNLRVVDRKLTIEGPGPTTRPTRILPSRWLN